MRITTNKLHVILIYLEVLIIILSDENWNDKTFFIDKHVAFNLSKYLQVQLLTNSVFRSPLQRGSERLNFFVDQHITLCFF